MTDETKPIAVTSQPARLEGTLEVGAQSQSNLTPVENKRDTSGDQSTGVRALKTFHKDGDMRGEMAQPGDEFEVPRSRAAQLRANGLIEYTNDGDDHAIHGEANAKLINEKVALQAKASEIPANSKGTPLRNPEVKLADLKPGK